MSVTVTDSPDCIAEKAFAAYIRGFRDTGADSATNPNEIAVACIRSGHLEGLGIHEGRQTTQRESTAVVVKCTGSERVYQDANWHNLTVEIELYTNRSVDTDGTTRAEVLHGWREAEIDALFRTEGQLKAAINKPVGVDSRDVQNVHLIGLVGIDTTADVESNTFVKRWSIAVMLAPFDPLPA